MKLIRIIMIVIFVSCSKSEKPMQLIAKVDDKPIYLNDFINQYREFINDMGFKDNLLFRTEFLEQNIERTLLLDKAESIGLMNQPNIKKEIQMIKNQILLNHFNKLEVFDKIIIDDVDLRKAFIRSKTQIHARHLFSRSLEGINQFKKRLDNGESFEELSPIAFKDSVLQNNGGDIGYFTFNEMDLNFEKAAFHLEDGEISEPVKVRGGYSIIQVLDRWIEPILTEHEFQLQKNKLIKVLKLRRKNIEVEKFTDSLKENLTLDIDRPTLNLIIKDLNSIALGHLDKFKNEVEFSIIKQIAETSINQRSKINSVENLRELLLGIKVRNKILSLAQASNWINDAHLEIEIQNRINDIVISHTINFLNENETLLGENFKELIEELKKGKDIYINNSLLKRFLLI